MNNRRKFLENTIKLSSGFVVLPSVFNIQQVESNAIDPKVVFEFVNVAHKDFEKVKQMLGEYPHLLNAAWDWGDGDFETAIGAASHMGLKDMTLYLMDKGARFDIFTLAFLGKTALVKAMIDDKPSLLQCIGPHGFTLLHHAQKAGQDGAELVEYLKAKGLTESHIPTFNKK